MFLFVTSSFIQYVNNCGETRISSISYIPFSFFIIYEPRKKMGVRITTFFNCFDISGEKVYYCIKINNDLLTNNLIRSSSSLLQAEN